MPNDTIVDLIRTLIWYDWEHSLPFQDFGDSTQCFLLRIRLSCSHPAVKALLADWRIHRTAFENGRITSSDYLESVSYTHLEYGTKFCSNSPSIPETELHQAILKAVQNLAAKFTGEVADQLNGILHQIEVGESLTPQLQAQ